MKKEGSIKKMLSIMLSVLMVLTAFPITTLNASAEVIKDQPCPVCGADEELMPTCLVCGGTGLVDMSDSMECPICDGGICSGCNGSGINEDGSVCDECKGSGKCSVCNGTGKTFGIVDNTFKINTKDASIDVGDSFTLNASSEKRTGNLYFWADDDSIAKVDENGVVTALSVGTTKINVILESDGLYITMSESCEVTVNAATPKVTVNTERVFTGQTLADTNITASATVGDVEIPGTVTWDDDSAEIKLLAEDNLTTEYAFTFTPDDINNYNEVHGVAKVVVIDADENLTVLTTDGTTTTTYKYNEDLKISLTAVFADSGETAENIEWTSKNSIADVDENGIVTIKGVGTAEFEALATDDNGEQSYGNYAIIIEKGTYNAKFNNDYDVSLTYGEQENYSNEIDLSSVPFDNPEIEYSCDSEDIVDTIDNSRISLKDGVQTGSAVITANIAETDFYEAAEASYTIQLSAIPVEDNMFKIQGQMANDWYTTDKITITPTDGYEVSASNLINNNNWKNEIEFDIPTSDVNKIAFYVKDKSNGRITYSKELGITNVDTDDPYDVKISYADGQSYNIIEKFFDDITFHFFKKTVKLQFRATDASSDITKFIVSLDDSTGNYNKDEFEVTKDENGEFIFEIEKNFEGTITARAVDEAEHESDSVVSDFEDLINATSVVDLVSPKVTVIYTDEKESLSSEKYYTSRTVTIEITEDYLCSFNRNSDGYLVNIDAEIKAKNDATDTELYPEILFQLDKMKDPSNWNHEGNVYKYILVFDEDAHYTFEINSVTDLAGNPASEIEYKGEAANDFVIDQTAPTVSVEYDNNDVINGFYFNKNRTATIKVIEDNFNGASADISATDVRNMPVDLSDDLTDQLEKMKDPANWNHEGNVYKYTLVFNEDAHYTFEINSVTDLAGNTANEIEYKGEAANDFVIDQTAPTVSVEYDNNDVINGFYFNKNRTATIKVIEDNFNGAKIDISAQDVTEKTVDISELKVEIEKLAYKNEWSNVGDNVYTATINYNVDANYNFVISVTDMANNEVLTKEVDFSDSSAPTKFTIDKVAPDDIKFEFVKTPLSKILNVLSFGVFFNGEIAIDVHAKDETAGLWKAEMKIMDEYGNVIDTLESNDVDFETSKDKFRETYSDKLRFNLSEAKLQSVKGFKGFIDICVSDKSGNCYHNQAELDNGEVFLEDTITVLNQTENSDGFSIDNYLIYENADTHCDNSSITIKPQQDKKSYETKAATVDLSGFIDENYLLDKDTSYMADAPLFSENVKFNVEIADVYSGINKAQIVVYNNNTRETVSNSKYDIIGNKIDGGAVNWSITAKADDEKIATNLNASIEVSEDANDLVVLVVLTDNAGNISYDYYNFGIDKTAPQITYNFKTGGATTENGNYYNRATTFTVTVADRNFPKGSETVGTISYTVNGIEKSYILNANDFTALNNDVNYSDNQRYTYTFSKLTDEGEYENFVFKAVDRATNEKTVKPSIHFCYDYTAPIIRIVSDSNQSYTNGHFYQDRRIITVTVTDRYFTERAFTFRNTSGTYTFVSDSEANQKYHTNNRTFTYTFDYSTSTSIDCVLNNFAAKDLAGNVASNIPTVTNGNNFVVDGKTPNNFSVTIKDNLSNAVNVLNQNDYKVFVSDDLILTITCTDENLAFANLSNVELGCRALSSTGVAQNVRFNLEKIESDRNHITYRISNLDMDGFYDMTFTITDDSGKQSAVQNVSFAICRNGAIYDQKSLDTISGKIVNANNISDNVVFKQYSASGNTVSQLEISSDSVQFPRRILVEGEDYVVSRDSSVNYLDGGYVSVYTLLPNAFMLDGVIQDGVYTIKVTPLTTSESGETSNNAPSQTFIVTIDATNPTIDLSLDYVTSYNKEYNDVIVSDEQNIKVFSDKVTAKINLADSYSGINENSIQIQWTNGDSSQEAEILDFDGENGYYTVEFSHSDAANGGTVIVTAKDMAENSISKEFTLKIDNNFKIYVALGVFAAVALIAIIVIVIAMKKKSKQESD